MRRVTVVAILLALAISAGVNRTSARPAQSGGDLLQFLPDGSAVVVIDVHKMTTSSLWGVINSQDKIKSNLDKMHSEFSDLGVKLSDLQTVAVAFQSADMNNPVVAITGGFDQTDLLTRLRANVKFKLTSEKYKDHDIYKIESAPAATKDQPKENKPAATADGKANSAARAKNDGSFAFYDAKTVVVGSPESVRASIDTKTGAKTSIAQNAKLAEALAQNPTAAVRFAFNVTPAMTSGIQSNQVPLPDFSSVKMIFGSVDVASGVDLIATLRNDTAEHAKNIADRLNGLLEMVRGYVSTMGNDPKMAAFAGALKTVSVTGTDVDVKISGNLPMEVFTQIIK
ncbi:MAG TPA: hypothetical protein VNI02_23460 [Blastocatellia bacterium]|jgi:hypothetical protein|nr:hypothetical protein [Blastocatellia bacterium]